MELATRILAIRHGETAWNLDSRIQGHLDVPLNDTGLWQAERTAQAVAAEGVQAIYASDLLRAQQTAQALARTTGLSVRSDTALRERGFGRFEGHTYHEIELRWPEQAARWRAREPDFGPGGGESLRVFFQRCVAAITRMAAAHPDQTIAVVAHGGVMDCLYRAASRIELQVQRSWPLGNASINRLLYTPGGFTLIGWSDSAHLERAALDEASDGAAPGS